MRCPNLSMTANPAVESAAPPLARRSQRGSIASSDSERKHLTRREVERLIEAAKGSRNEARDRCLLLLMFRHGLRVSEACRMKLNQVDTESRVLQVVRLKGGVSTTQMSLRTFP